MVVACRGDAWRLAASMAQRLISRLRLQVLLRVARCWAGAARRWTQCSRLVRMTQTRLPVSILLKCTGVLCRCSQSAGRAFCPTLLQLRAATRAVTRERTTSQGALEMYITKRPCKKSASGKCPAGRAYEKTTSPDCLAAPSRKGSSPTATCAPDRRVENRRPAGPRKEAVAAAPAPTTGAAAAPATAARKGLPSAPVDESRGRGASGARSPCQRGSFRTASRARPTRGGSFP